MGTITEDYVSFEVAKLLKEKGFPLPSTNFRDWLCCMYDENQNIHWGCYDKNWYFRITHQMAMKWLREKGWNITIDCIDVTETGLVFTIKIVDMKSFFEYRIDYDNIYEKAVEVGIKYCLENLI